MYKSVRLVFMAMVAMLAIGYCIPAFAHDLQSHSKPDCCKVQEAVISLRNEHNALTNAYNAWLDAPDGPLAVADKLSVTESDTKQKEISVVLDSIKVFLGEMSHPDLQKIGTLATMYQECAILIDLLAAGEDISDDMHKSLRAITENLLLLVERV